MGLHALTGRGGAEIYETVRRTPRSGSVARLQRHLHLGLPLGAQRDGRRAAGLGSALPDGLVEVAGGIDAAVAAGDVDLVTAGLGAATDGCLQGDVSVSLLHRDGFGRSEGDPARALG